MAKRQSIQSFSPAVGDSPHTLVLGSIPGVPSLVAGQYYGNPRNAFWRIAAHHLGFDVNLGYEQRVAALNAAGVALWDVIGACSREASSDSSIRDTEPNDIPGLIRSESTIRRILLNGSTAAKLFEQRVVRGEEKLFEAVEIHRLPSTSPAFAAMPYAKKLDAWRVLAPS